MKQRVSKVLVVMDFLYMGRAQIDYDVSDAKPELEYMIGKLEDALPESEKKLSTI